MKNDSTNYLRFVIKDISNGQLTPFIGYNVQVTILNDGFRDGGVSITFAFLKAEWIKFMKFLEETNNPAALPDGKIAYSGYDISNDKVFYHEPIDFDSMNRTLKELSVQTTDIRKREKIERRVNQDINESKADEQKLKEGETVSKHVLIKTMNVLVVMKRADFKRMRERCLSFEAKKGEG